MKIIDIAGGSGLNAREQLLFREYTANRFRGAEIIERPDASFLRAWEKIVGYAGQFGAAEAINKLVCPGRPVAFRSPEMVRLEIYDSCAGGIPILYVRDTADFEQLVTNIAHKGVRPDGLSLTGASFLSGKNTRFIILSAKPYSNVPAAELGLPDEARWLEQSLLLRRGHECTHYYTKQTYGVANNLLHDELMADFMGMYEAFGFYRADWFLRFMGVIPGSGGRLVYYTKDLPEAVRRAVTHLAELAARGLERWSQTDAFRAMTAAGRIQAMCAAGLEGMPQLG